MKTTYLFYCLSLLTTGSLLSQKEYKFASTAQQELLINPSFAGSSKGLKIQTLYAFNNHPSIFGSGYAGVSYGFKKLGIALSNTNYFSNAYYDKYSSNQTDLSISYKIKLSSKVTLVPSVQASFLTAKRYYNQWILDHVDALYSDYMGNPKKKSVSFSSGLLLDINKTLTLGAACYDINEPEAGISGVQKILISQVYHASLLLFKEKKITLQPYAILRIHSSYGYNYGRTEFGLYASYKFISIQLGTISDDIPLVAGASFYLKGLRLGYTYRRTYGCSSQEVFLSANLFSGTKAVQRNLMLN